MTDRDRDAICLEFVDALDAGDLDRAAELWALAEADHRPSDMLVETCQAWLEEPMPTGSRSS